MIAKFLILAFTLKEASVIHDAAECGDQAEKTRCENKVLSNYYLCTSGCNESDDQPLCMSECNRGYVEELKKCPCNENCPDGCPCPEFECESPVTTSQVLILHLKEPIYYDNTPVSMVADVTGAYTQTNIGDWGHAIVYKSCSLKFKNRMLVYGGFEDPHLTLHDEYQIAEVTYDGSTTDVQTIGQLPFPFERGACAVANDDKIVLCFPRLDDRGCKVSSDIFGPFTNTTMSITSHARTAMAASSDALFVVGDKQKNSARAELMDISDASPSEWKWTETTSYPYESVIYQAPIVHYADSFYVFGGTIPDLTRSHGSSLIAQFAVKSETWSIWGNLQETRRMHGAILVDGISYMT